MKDKSDCIMGADCKLIPSSFFTVRLSVALWDMYTAKPFGDLHKVIVRESFLGQYIH